MTQIVQSTFVAGFIENWVIVLDTGNLGVLGFPFKAGKQLATILQLIFVCTLHRMYIMNPSSSFGALFAMSKPMIPADSQTKIVVVKKNELAKLNEDIDPDQIPKEYGGTLDVPEQLWPIPNTLGPDLAPVNPEMAQQENNEPTLSLSDVIVYPEIVPEANEVVKPTEESLSGFQEAQRDEETKSNRDNDQRKAMELDEKAQMLRVSSRKSSENAKSKRKPSEISQASGRRTTNDKNKVLPIEENQKGSRQASSHYGKYDIQNKKTEEPMPRKGFRGFFCCSCWA